MDEEVRKDLRLDGGAPLVDDVSRRQLDAPKGYSPRSFGVVQDVQ